DDPTGGAVAVYRRGTFDDLDTFDDAGVDGTDVARAVHERSRLRSTVDNDQHGAAAEGLTRVGTLVGRYAEPRYGIAQHSRDVGVDLGLGGDILAVQDGYR